MPKRETQRLLVNEEIAKRTQYGLREEVAPKWGYVLTWSNGSGRWFRDREVTQRGELLTLDANQIFVADSAEFIDSYIEDLDQLPLYANSFEGIWGRLDPVAEVSKSLSRWGWEIAKTDEMLNPRTGRVERLSVTKPVYYRDLIDQATNSMTLAVYGVIDPGVVMFYWVGYPKNDIHFDRSIPSFVLRDKTPKNVMRAALENELENLKMLGPAIQEFSRGYRGLVEKMITALREV